jgi:hypothetical protein
MLIDDALRILHIDMLEHGYSAQTLGEWPSAMHWFAHFNYRDETLALAPDEWLTPWRRENGGLPVTVEGEPVAVEFDSGDAVMREPSLEHPGGVNRAGSPRYGVSFGGLQEP